MIDVERFRARDFRRLPIQNERGLELEKERGIFLSQEGFLLSLSFPPSMIPRKETLR
jgi:hypothetical protein